MMYFADEVSWIHQNIPIHPERNMRDCAKYHGYPSSHWDDSFKTTNVSLMILPQGKSGDHQSQEDSSCGNPSEHNIVLIHSIL